ncbi:MAG: hypothetical protein ABIJ39_06515, partial [Chloroflexota bacterium]
MFPRRKKLGAVDPFSPVEKVYHNFSLVQRTKWQAPVHRVPASLAIHFTAACTKYNHINSERYNGGMKPIQVPPLTEEQLAELEELYQKTKKPRYRTR